MIRRSAIILSATMFLGLAMPPGGALAEQKSLKQQLVGTWIFVEGASLRPDGIWQGGAWGPDPKGVYMFDANGNFAQILARSDLPKVSNRNDGTPAQDKAVVQGSIAMYGKYTVDEADKSVIVRVVGSSFAGFNGTETKRVITSITADEMKIRNPGTSIGVLAESTWRRAK